MVSKKSDIVAVAKAARVSPSTVSRSFNHPELVKAATRKKIDAAVRKLGYIRNRAAQTIHGIRSGTVGLIVPTIDHAIFAELIQSFSDTMEQLGFTILLASHGYDLRREYAVARKMLEHRVDGMALIGIAHEAETLHLLQSHEIPTVLLWNYAAGVAFPSVGADNYQAGWRIADHVAALGHRDIAVLFPPIDGNDRASERFRGVVAGLAHHGVAIAPERRLETPYSVGDAKAATADLLCQSAAPTALICGNDVLAWGAIHAAHKSGLMAPRDLTITGIGDFKGSRAFEPPLTTVRIPARQIGEKAGNLIAKRIITPGGDAEGERIIPELIIRGTCGPAP